MSFPVGGSPRGYEQVTGLSVVKMLTVPASAGRAQIAVSGQGVRYRDDGVDPDGTTGFPLAAGTEFVYAGNIRNLRFIQVAASAVLDVLYYQ